MSIRVIIPPEPIVEPSDIAGADAADPAVAAQIAAVVGEIDGPEGWLGRALGPQTLELRLDCWSSTIMLPCPPLIEVVSVSYVGRDDVVSPVSDTLWDADGDYLWFKSWHPPALSCNPEPIRIRYRAGYDGIPVADGGTGSLPPQVKQAVILATQHMRAIGAENLFIRAEETDGVGRTEFTVSEQAGNIIRQASERLLSGLRRYV